MDSVVCGSCRARIRADRPRCLRCGVALRAREALPGAGRTSRPSGVDIPRRWSLTALVAVVVVGVALVVDWSGEANARSSSDATRAGSVARQSRVSRAPSRPAALMPDGRAAAVDAMRVGVAAYQRGETAAALQAFQAAADAAPDDPEALNNLGQALVRAGRAREALPLFERVVVAHPDRWAYRFNRARAYGELGDWPRAVQGYREAAGLFPDDYATQFNLAKALDAAGQRADAVAAYRRFLDLAPGTGDRDAVEARIAQLAAS